MHRTHTFTHCTALEYILLLSCLLDPENTHTGPPFWTPAIIFPWRLMNEPGRTRAGSGSKRPLMSAHKSGTESFSFRPHKNEPLSTNEPLWWFQVDPNGAGGELRRVWFKRCYRLWCWLLRVPQLVLEVLSRITPPTHTHTACDLTESRNARRVDALFIARPDSKRLLLSLELFSQKRKIDLSSTWTSIYLERGCILECQRSSFISFFHF